MFYLGPIYQYLTQITTFYMNVFCKIHFQICAKFLDDNNLNVSIVSKTTQCAVFVDTATCSHSL